MNTHVCCSFFTRALKSIRVSRHLGSSRGRFFFFAAIVLCHWVAQADGELIDVALRKVGVWPSLCLLREEMKPISVWLSSGLDLDQHFTSPLRDSKAHLINDQESMTSDNRNVMQRIGPTLSKQEIASVSERLDVMLQGLRTRVERIRCHEVV